jgi:hypothetical protein
VRGPDGRNEPTGMASPTSRQGHRSSTSEECTNTVSYCPMTAPSVGLHAVADFHIAPGGTHQMRQFLGVVGIGASATRDVVASATGQKCKRLVFGQFSRPRPGASMPEKARLARSEFGERLLRPSAQSVSSSRARPRGHSRQRSWDRRGSSLESLQL